MRHQLNSHCLLRKRLLMRPRYARRRGGLDDVAGSAKSLASASAFFNEAHLRCMKNEAGLRPMKRGFATRRSRVRFASCEHRERIMATQLPPHICEANASLTKL